MNILLVQTILALVYGLSVQIRKGRCNDTPFDICAANGKVGAAATSENIYTLMRMLKEHNIEKAYVYGWNDHSKVMVLYANGTIAPYSKFVNEAEYAFCTIDCPCPRDNVIATYYTGKGDNVGYCEPSHKVPDCTYVCKNDTSPQKPCEPVVNYKPGCKVESCPFVHKKPIKPVCRPPKDEDSCSSDETTEERAPRCPIFVKQSEKCHKEKKKCDTGKPFFKKELMSEFKTYTYGKSHRNKYVLKSLEETNVLKEEKYLIDERKGGSEHSNLPKLLRNPKLLKSIYHYLSCKFHEKICLYINDCNEIFALICEKFYKVEKNERRHSKRKFFVKRLDRRAAKKLLSRKLYGVTFEKDDC